MRVIPVKKSFGRYRVGEVFELPDKTARAFILIGSLRAAEPTTEDGAASERSSRRTYRRRDMQPES